MPEDVLFEEYEVIPELAQMRLPKEVLLDILDKALGDRGNVNSLDPLETGRTEMRRWVTRYLREDATLKELGWKLCRHGQIEGISNDELKIKLAFVNTNARTGIISKQPSNIAEKGTRTATLAEQNRRSDQYGLWDMDNVDETDSISLYDFWYFCGYAGDDYVSAEISRPDQIVGGFIRNFSKRIVICAPGKLDGLRAPNPVAEDFAEIDLPIITRKI